MKLLFTENERLNWLGENLKDGMIVKTPTGWRRVMHIMPNGYGFYGWVLMRDKPHWVKQDEIIFKDDWTYDPQITKHMLDKVLSILYDGKEYRINQLMEKENG